MCLQRPKPLGDRGRAHHVDEEEEASLSGGLAIPSQQKRPERAIADKARGLKHHHHDANGHEGETNRNQPGAQGIDVDDAQDALAWLAGENRSCDPPVDERLQDEHRSEGQRVEPSHRSARQQEELDAGDARSHEQGVDDTDRYGDQQRNEQRANARSGSRPAIHCTDARTDDRSHAHDAREAPQSIARDGGECDAHLPSTLRAPPAHPALSRAGPIVEQSEVGSSAIYVTPALNWDAGLASVGGPALRARTSGASGI
jgi:hypothetical protein